MKPLALVLAVVFFVVAILYWTGIVLPHHVKHGILAVVLGLLCLVWFRFQSASPATR
ncbi:MAG TPA: hypothetical protein VMA36_14530 [Candidatus Limnocylindria bacterium]|jgi:hypothetical protein|nr:hypothetical protein [Candidatus Limnocylindria bacterium]